MSSLFPKRISSWAKFAELIFFPSFCEFCSRLLEHPEERVICRSCWEEVVPCRSSYCLCCGRFFEGVGEPHFCLDCLEKRPPFSVHRSYGRYNGRLKDLIILYKYKHIQVLGRDLARFMYRVMGRMEEVWMGTEAVVAVPLHPKRKKQRGFNQALVLAKELGRLSGVEVVENALVKIKNVAPQTSLEEAKEREKNVSRAFGIKAREKIEGKVVLLVDDVYTTGSTIKECSSVLNQAGAEEVRALTIARA